MADLWFWNSLSYAIIVFNFPCTVNDNINYGIIIFWNGRKQSWCLVFDFLWASVINFKFNIFIVSLEYVVLRLFMAIFNSVGRSSNKEIHSVVWSCSCRTICCRNKNERRSSASWEVARKSTRCHSCGSWRGSKKPGTSRL